MADLVLCAPVVAREAKEQRKTLAAHYAHLLVHGTLHAQGWDHETSEADAEEMEALRDRDPRRTGHPQPGRQVRGSAGRQSPSSAAESSPARR